MQRFWRKYRYSALKFIHTVPGTCTSIRVPPTIKHYIQKLGRFARARINNTYAARVPLFISHAPIVLLGNPPPQAVSSRAYPTQQEEKALVVTAAAPSTRVYQHYEQSSNMAAPVAAMSPQVQVSPAFQGTLTRDFCNLYRYSGSLLSFTHFPRLFFRKRNSVPVLTKIS
jgi:hypothetical protein